MRIETLGDGEPDFAVLGGVHGDEPCGANAIQRVLAAEPTVEKPVAFVVANEEAAAAGKRYLEEDLNRAFPGKADGQTHESRLAARITRELGHCTTLSMHSTQSYEGTFALINDASEELQRILTHLSVDAAVDVGRHSAGRLFEGVPNTIEVECGYQGSAQATENAVDLVWEFLSATGIVPGDSQPHREIPLFRLERQIPKSEASSYDVYASNFEQVTAGEPYAAAGDQDVVAEESFYPVLMSPYGYESVFGYTAERLGTVGASGPGNEAI
jgi:predicted deacylase